MDQNDFRFKITKVEEPDDAAHQYFVQVIEILPADATWPCETDGPELEAFYTNDPFSAVEAAREAQAYSLEERFEMYAHQEMIERMEHGGF